MPQNEPPSPNRPTQGESKAPLPYWQIPGARPGYDARQRPNEKSSGPRLWYSPSRWQLERERCHISGPPQAPWREPTPIANVIASAIQKVGVHTSVALEYLIANWSDIVGSDVASKSHPISLDHGTLTLAVKNQIWMFALQRQMRFLLQAVQKTPHGADVKNIRLNPLLTERKTHP